MALIVHKYGGTSMGSVERIKNVAARVAKWHKAGHKMVVVPSAMSGETNRLLGLAKAIAPQPSPRELDLIAATGEQVSVGLLAIALQEEGVDAISYAGWQVPIETDSAFTKARISSIDDKRVMADLDAGRVVVITGFQASIPTATSRRSAAAVPTRRPWRWPRRSRPRNASFIPTSTVCTRPIRAWSTMRAGLTASHSKRCWKWPASVRKCCRSVRWSSRANTRSRHACCRA